MTTEGKLLTGLSGKFRFGVAVLVSFLLAFGSGGSAGGQLSGECSREIEIFAQQKSRAEDFARQLKKRYERKKLSEPSLLKGEALYNEARAAFNGYLTQFQFDLRTGREPSQKNLQAAVEKSEKFTAYADEQVYGASRGPALVVVIANLVAALTQAALNYWENYRKQAQLERDLLAQELDKLKWQPFDQIK
jgi:hypothetical protein